MEWCFVDWFYHLSVMVLRIIYNIVIMIRDGGLKGGKRLLSMGKPRRALK